MNKIVIFTSLISYAQPLSHLSEEDLRVAVGRDIDKLILTVVRVPLETEFEAMSTRAHPMSQYDFTFLNEASIHKEIAPS